MKKASRQATGTNRLQRRIARLKAAIARHDAGRKLLKKQNRELQTELEELKRTRNEIIQRERLHALGQMASGIVHDFNNSLTPILGASDFLLANPQMLSRQTETLRLLESIKIAANDAKSMVSRLREFYRPQKHAEAHLIDVNVLIEQSIMLTRPRWREQAGAMNIAVHVRKDLGQDCHVRIDACQLREVLANLIINAVDSLDRSGTITIRSRSKGGYVTIQVRDTGRGMTREVREHCFEPFFSTKGNEGTGLGLSVAYGIVRMYSGKIRVAASAPGKGTTMEIRMQAAERPAAGALAAEPAPGKSDPLNILVCEKDPLTRRTMAGYLRSDGHRVDLASSGRAALKKTRMSSFDLIFVDALMPSGNGATMSSILTEASPSCAIVMTGSSSFEPGPEGVPGAVAAVLDKPFTHRDLRVAIFKALNSTEEPLLE